MVFFLGFSQFGSGFFEGCCVLFFLYCDIVVSQGCQKGIRVFCDFVGKCILVFYVMLLRSKFFLLLQYQENLVVFVFEDLQR